MVVIFAFLIIPATISALFSSNLIKRLLTTWAIGGGVTIIGFLFADWLDFSVGPTISFFLGVALIFAGLYR